MADEHFTEVIAASATADTDLFTMGYWLIALTVSISVVGMFVGLACAVNGRRSVRFRPIWVAAAAVSIGGVGIWLASTVSLLGVSIPGRTIRYDGSQLTVSLLFAVAAVFVCLLIAGREFQPKRMAVAAVSLSVGTGVMLWLQLTSVDIEGSVQLTYWLFLLATLLAVAAAALCLWLFQRFRFPAARVGSVLLFAAGVAAFSFTGVSGLEFRLQPNASAPEGTELFGYVFPMFVLGLLALSVPITAVLVAPERPTEAAVPEQQPDAGTGHGPGGGAGVPGAAGGRLSAAAALAQRSQPLPGPAR